MELSAHLRLPPVLWTARASTQSAGFVILPLLIFFGTVAWVAGCLGGICSSLACLRGRRRRPASTAAGLHQVTLPSGFVVSVPNGAIQG